VAPARCCCVLSLCLSALPFRGSGAPTPKNAQPEGKTKNADKAKSRAEQKRRTRGSGRGGCVGPSCGLQLVDPPAELKHLTPAVEQKANAISLVTASEPESHTETDLGGRLALPSRQTKMAGETTAEGGGARCGSLRREVRGCLVRSHRLFSPRSERGRGPNGRHWVRSAPTKIGWNARFL